MNFARRAFTLLEIIIAIAVISVALSTAVYILNNSSTFLQNTEIKIKNTNLAREWIEWMFQIRDSNRLRRSEKKDKCWLKIDPLVDSWSVGCENDAWMLSGQYVLEQATQDSTQYIKLSRLTTPIDFTNGIQDDESSIALCNNTNWRYPCNDSGANTWRVIEIHDLYDKVNNQVLDCPNGEAISSISCGGTNAKEIQFCVYVGDRRNNSTETLCSSMTNFQ